MSYVLTFSRIVIGLVFAISGIGKLRSIHSFEQALVGFRILPKQFIRPAVGVVLMSEFAVVVLMVLGGTSLAIGFAAAVVLLLVFCVALLSALARGIQTPCNCFGPSNRAVSRYDVWRNAAFIACASVGLASFQALQGRLADAAPPTLALLGAPAAVFVAFWAYLGEIVGVLRPSRRGHPG